MTTMVDEEPCGCGPRWTCAMHALRDLENDAADAADEDGADDR